MTSHNIYNKLMSHIRKMANLESCSLLLMWDQQTYMPTAGAKHRAEQLSLLAGMYHDLATAPEVNEWLVACEQLANQSDPHSDIATNIRELRREYDRRVKIPKDLVQAIASATSNAHASWEEALKLSRFSIFCSHLDRVVLLKREYADALGYEHARYDALLEGYEPDLRTQSIQTMFDSLRPALIDLIHKSVSSSCQPDESVLRRFYPMESQKYFAETVAAKVGFDFSGGRLDTVSHPFSVTIGPGDLRISSRWNENDIGMGLFAVLHETGHALYEQGLPIKHWGTPAGSAKWLSIHESQSRLLENYIGRSLPFWQYFFPKLKDIFPSALHDVDIQQFQYALNYVRPSLNRVGADELTYNLHIILRFELESALINGTLSACDLPDAWNAKISELFSLKVPDDARGCLQDAHWADGDFAYFPTYTLGNLYAAQFFASIRTDIPNLNSELSKGEFHSLVEWLRKNIHSKASCYRPNQLCIEVTGEPLSQRFLISSLRDKFSALYGF